MAIRAFQSVSVGTSAVALTDNTTSSLSVLVKNTGASTVYLGTAGVTSANGFPWAAADGPISFDLGSGEVLYGICASATSSTVAVLETDV